MLAHEAGRIPRPGALVVEVVRPPGLVSAARRGSRRRAARDARFSRAVGAAAPRLLAGSQSGRRGLEEME